MYVRTYAHTHSRTDPTHAMLYKKPPAITRRSVSLATVEHSRVCIFLLKKIIKKVEKKRDFNVDEEGGAVEGGGAINPEGLQKLLKSLRE